MTPKEAIAALRRFVKWAEIGALAKVERLEERDDPAADLWRECAAGAHQLLIETDVADESALAVQTFRVPDEPGDYVFVLRAGRVTDKVLDSIGAFLAALNVRGDRRFVLVLEGEADLEFKKKE